MTWNRIVETFPIMKRKEAERGRGLLLIDRLATRWGSRAVVEFAFCAGLGTVVWAEFTLATDSAAPVGEGFVR